MRNLLVGTIAQGLPMSIKNYLNEAIAYLMRSRFGIILKPIIDFSLTKLQTSHTHHPFYTSDRILFKIVSTKIAIAIFWWLGFVP
jgi:hypothetical protein